EEERRPRERLGRDSLRESGRPDTGAAGVREVVLPDEPAGGADAAGEERRGEPSPGAGVARRDEAVELGEAQKRLEPVAVARVIPVDDPVAVTDVACGAGRSRQPCQHARGHNAGGRHQERSTTRHGAPPLDSSSARPGGAASAASPTRRAHSTPGDSAGLLTGSDKTTFGPARYSSRVSTRRSASARCSA